MESRCYLVCKLRNKTLHIYFRLMAAIFDLPVTPTLESIHTSFTVLLDLDNVVVAVGNTPSHMCFRYHIRHFDFRFNTDGFLAWCDIVGRSGDFVVLEK